MNAPALSVEAWAAAYKAATAAAASLKARGLRAEAFYLMLKANAFAKRARGEQ